MHVKNQAFPAHEPRFRRGLALGYAVSPTGPDHIYGFQDDSAASAGTDGFILNPWLRSMGVLEPMMLNSLGPEKVRASVYHSMTTGALNCMPFCLFVLLGTGMSLNNRRKWSSSGRLGRQCFRVAQSGRTGSYPGPTFQCARRIYS